MLIRFLGVIFLIVLIFGVVSYANGWLVFDNTDGSTNVEVKTDEMKQATEDAVKKGGELIEQAGDQIKQSTENDQTPNR